MRIGIFGGSFNPPHNMHLKMATMLLSNDVVDRVIFVPTGSKYPKKGLATGIDRYEMIKLMINDISNLEVSDYELKQDLVYTYQTLDYFKNLYPNDEIFFILGSDLLKNFDTWTNYQYILDNFKILVTLRNDDCIEEFNKLAFNHNNLIFTNVKLDILSSTEIRSAIASKDISFLNKNMNNDVIKYINSNNLYS